MLAQTPLYDWHVAHGGRMVEFAGWLMPVQYSSIVAEHNATRNSIGLFDISHMGRLRFSGPDAGRLLDRVVTRRASRLAPGRIQYALVTNEQGGIKDDVLVYHLLDGAGQPYFLMVVNAVNREKIVSWIQEHRRESEDLQFTDATHDWAMIAVQGPRALALLRGLVDVDLDAMQYYSGTEARVAGYPGIISRTGYTGEDGFEVIVGAARAEALWRQLVERGQQANLPVVPAGLGCRDTLRLEAGMPLYGHELSEQINPYQAGLGFAVDLVDACFPGAEALARAKDDASLPCRVGLTLQGKRVPREGFAILSADATSQVGQVTSGTFSPTFNQPLAMGYVQRQYATQGIQLLVDIRGRNEPAAVTRLPFYRRKSQKERGVTSDGPMGRAP